MAVSIAVRIRGTQSAGEGWSFAALLLAAVGVAASIWFVVASQTDTDDVRWWLVVAPLFVMAAPVLLARHAVRVGAMVALAGWCFLAVFSIGMLQLPALVAAVIAVLRDSR
jgi:hypothetical protein